MHGPGASALYNRALFMPKGTVAISNYVEHRKSLHVASWDTALIQTYTVGVAESELLSVYSHSSRDQQGSSNGEDSGSLACAPACPGSP